MKIKTYGISDVGKIRELNEDSFGIYNPGVEYGCFAVLADGMGGHNAGEVASSMAVDLIASELEKSAAERSRDVIVYNIVSAIDYANKKIFDLSVSDLSKSGMGSTLVAAYVNGEDVYFANIGDSRAYVIGEDNIKQVTVDHSLVQEMVDKGMITKEEAKHHPEKNLITRALGTEKFVEADIFEYSVKQGDIVLLCSDGLVEYIDEKDIRDIVRNAGNIEEAAKKLVSAANDGGGHDNITVVILEFDK